MSSDSDPVGPVGDEALIERIAVVRQEIEAIRKVRGPRREAKKLAEIAELTEKVRAAKERLREANAQRREAPEAPEKTLRGGLYWSGAVITVIGVAVLFFAYETGVFTSGSLGDRIEPTLMLSIPLVVGIGLLARARFAKYRAGSKDLDGDFL